MRNPVYFFGIFAVIGLPCLVLAVYFGFTTLSQSGSWDNAQGTITGFDQSNYPYVSFEYKGEPHKIRSSYTSTDMNMGDAVTVRFPPNEPNQAQIDSFFSNWFLPLFLSIFGLVFGGVGGVGIYFIKKKQNARRELFDEGRGKKISADLTGVNIDRSYRVNGRSPYVITAQWVETGTQLMYLFKSDYIWYDPTSIMGEKKKIDVYVDEQNMKRYYMDISFLPKQAN